MKLISKEIFNFSDSIFKSLGYNKHPSIWMFDLNVPMIEQRLEDEKDYIFTSKTNLGFCRKIRNILTEYGIDFSYTHKNPWQRLASSEVSGLYYYDSFHIVKIILHMNAKENTYKENWDKIKFDIISVLCHECIHLLRAQRKEFRINNFLASDSDLKLSKNLAEERYYLSDVEEIFAYAMQITMEEKFYGESGTLNRYYDAFSNKKLKCAPKVLISLGQFIEKFKRMPLHTL